MFTPRLVEDTSCVRATMTCTTRSTLTRSTRRRRGEFHGRAGSTKGRSYNARIAGGSSTSGLCHELPIVDSMTWVPSNVVSMFIKYSWSSTLLELNVAGGKKNCVTPALMDCAGRDLMAHFGERGTEVVSVWAAGGWALPT